MYIVSRSLPPNVTLALAILSIARNHSVQVRNTCQARIVFAQMLSSRCWARRLTILPAGDKILQLA